MNKSSSSSKDTNPLIRAIDAIEARLAQSCVEFSFSPQQQSPRQQGETGAAEVANDIDKLVSSTATQRSAPQKEEANKLSRSLRKSASKASVGSDRRPNSANVSSHRGNVDENARYAQELLNKKAQAEAASKLQAELKLLQEQKEAEMKRKEEIFPKKDACFYLYVLGNSYRTALLRELDDLKSTSTQPFIATTAIEAQPILQEYKNRCLRSFREACAVANNCLEIFDTLRLACLYSLCKALEELDDNPIEAKLIALSTYELGTQHCHPLNQFSIDILQKLRDEFLMVSVQQDNADEIKDDDAVVVNEVGNTKKAKLKKVLSFSTYSMDSKSRLSQYTSTKDKASKQKNELLSSTALEASIPSSISKELTDLIVSIRRGIFVPDPIALEDFSSSADIYQAADQIFKIYVRGNALAGLQTNGSEVSLDNRALALNRFLLEGPFLSWRGFVAVLTDFKVVSIHDAIKINDGSSAVADEGSESSEDDKSVAAPIRLMQAALVFQESSRSTFPCLNVDQFTPFRYEDVSKDETRLDAWQPIYDWFTILKNDPQKISAGLNLIQFVDALGKCGMIAYSEGRVADMLSTPQEKIEHFLTAFMGLNNRDKWRTILKNRIKKIKLATSIRRDDSSSKS